MFLVSCSSDQARIFCPSASGRVLKNFGLASLKASIQSNVTCFEHIAHQNLSLWVNTWSVRQVPFIARINGLQGTLSLVIFSNSSGSASQKLLWPQDAVRASAQFILAWHKARNYKTAWAAHYALLSPHLGVWCKKYLVGIVFKLESSISIRFLKIFQVSLFLYFFLPFHLWLLWPDEVGGTVDLIRNVAQLCPSHIPA